MKTKGGKAKTTKAKTTKPSKKGKRKVRNVKDFASLSETRSVTVSNGPVTNTLYSLMNTSLDQFTRASTVAQAYQLYRIKYIQLRLKPSFDTYAVAATANSKPNLFYMIDKSGSIPTNITLEGLKQMGAKPRAFDEKPLTIGWKPSVLTADMTAGGAAFTVQPSQYKISPWLNTNANSVDIAAWNPSTIDHLGVYWYVEQAIANPGNQPYAVEMEVQFEFKKPLIARTVGRFSAVPVQLAQLNASRDGIVDSHPGGDDIELAS